ncbi:hypothetical protein S7711_07111 [Stachybotrys chartarum IBT 7711]|uniref:Uncharacterized protein n=1 Tax=Stachybotrys chartarum (strain CBS 109288 / IBT 7711) TaxID=1280523 RepID=A0A084B336_STACB|nr:hypothetical protein S7711_07111 [Stachybotrys chartarum IBT 7711]KFA50659.1 hypothetical protein S40293_04887 [Stachybotrys chartarum IBT 40293]
MEIYPLERLSLFQGKIFQVFGPRGSIIFLPPRYIEELKSHPDVELATSKEFFHYDYHAFKAMAESDHTHMLVNTVTKKLTPALGLITEPVNDENHHAIPSRFPPTEEWTRIKFVPKSVDLISQVSSRIFIGAPLCRDREWIDVAKMFTIDLVTVSFMMNLCPSPLRPLYHMFAPQVKNLQKTIERGRKLIQPEVDRRRAAMMAARSRGEKPQKHLDSIDWMLELAEAQGLKDFDMVHGQLAMTFMAIHTTSTTLTILLYDLINNPHLIEEVRKEIIQAYTEDRGWKKTTLYKLKLLDSIMKESHRTNTGPPFTMARYVNKNVTLSDGQVLPKGATVAFTNMHMNEDSTWPNAAKFDGYRFLNLRNQPGSENRWQFVTTTPQEPTFGHGHHACPGRFFASNEVKLVMVHLIMKYDWKFIDGKKPAFLFPEAAIRPLDEEAEIMYKSRRSEIDFT